MNGLASGRRARIAAPSRSATQVIASMVGILCGISGLEHGFFETLQGSAAPDGLLIAAIGPAHRFWPGGTETALTIVPNFLITGILAMLASALVIAWSAAFIHRKYGAAVFLLLSVVQFLVGGGFAQIFLVLVTAAAATQIGAPLDWWRRLLPAGAHRLLGRGWLVLLVVFSAGFLGAMIAAVFGYFPLASDLFSLRDERLSGFLVPLGYSLLGLLPLTFLSGISHDLDP